MKQNERLALGVNATSYSTRGEYRQDWTSFDIDALYRTRCGTIQTLVSYRFLSLTASISFCTLTLHEEKAISYSYIYVHLDIRFSVKLDNNNYFHTHLEVIV